MAAATGHSLAVPMLTDEQRADLTHAGSPYSAEDKIAIAMAEIVEGGNATKAAEKASLVTSCPIPADTIRQWKSRAAWWPEAQAIARKMLQMDLDKKYTRLMDLTEKEMVDRVTKGDQMLNKEGKLVRVPAKLRDLVVTHGVISDKRAMVRGEPTSRKEDTGVDLILRLADALQKQGEKKIQDALPGTFEVVDESD